MNRSNPRDSMGEWLLVPMRFAGLLVVLSLLTSTATAYAECA
jgi:hypothetical protein